MFFAEGRQERGRRGVAAATARGMQLRAGRLEARRNIRRRAWVSKLECGGLILCAFPFDTSGVLCIAVRAVPLSL